jgi:DNA replication protein DnaC
VKHGRETDEEAWFKKFCPEIYKKADLSHANMRQAELVKEAKKWAQCPLEKRISIVLEGNPGSGKTWFAFALIRESFKYYPNCIWPRYFDSVELDALLLDAMMDEGDRDLMLICKSCDILFIDDLGWENDTDRVIRQYYEIFNSRINHAKPMIITTNKSLKDFKEKFGRAFASRVGGKFNFAWIPLNDLDRRG